MNPVSCIDNSPVVWYVALYQKMWNDLLHRGAVISSMCWCKLLSSECVILVYQSNNIFIFIQFLHVFDVFSGYQPFVDYVKGTNLISKSSTLIRSWTEFILYLLECGEADTPQCFNPFIHELWNHKVKLFVCLKSEPRGNLKWVVYWQRASKVLKGIQEQL